MQFDPTGVVGLYLLRTEPINDERGHFARIFCRDEFANRGLISAFSQSSISFNLRAGTVRGMHYSIGPRAETKIVRCTTGAICDVVVDIRPHSPSFGRALAFQLTAINRLSLYIPKGVAHGFQTLSGETEVLYAIDHPFDPSAARGIRWDDPIAKIEWPLPIQKISDRDRTYADFVPGEKE